MGELMSQRYLTVILIAATFAVAPARAGVKVSASEEPTTAPETATNVVAAAASAPEPAGKAVVFAVADGRYLTANKDGAIDLTGIKVGSKQRFTIIDENDGELADGDSVKIRYTPNTGGVPDPTKATYWREKEGGVKRGKEGATFKLKKVGAKFAFQTAGGKFVTGTVTEGALGLSDKQEAALLVEIIVVPASGKIPKKPAAE
jgi:hypothetical protein